MAVPEIKPDLATSLAVNAPELRNSRQRWWLLVLLFSAMLVSYVHRGAFSVAAPYIAQDLNLSKAGIGVILSAFFWVYSFMQVPAGWIVDRYGVKRAYSLAFLFWSLSSTLAGFARGVVSLIGLRVALGGGQAITFPASSRAVANSFPQGERGAVTGIYLTGVRFGAALVNAIGAYFLARYSWKLFFLIIGLIPLIWILPWMKFLNKWERSPAQQNRRTPETKGSFLHSLKLLRRRSVLGIFLGFFA